MVKKKKCKDCKHFHEMFYKDGSPAYCGRCRNPKNNRVKIATTGNYSTNTCEHFEEREG